jgi:hypothetical protein
MEEPIAMRNQAVSNATGVVSLPPLSLSNAPNDLVSHILDCAICLDIIADLNQAAEACAMHCEILRGLQL